jgi:tRNA pseudouridine38-40 synthase
VSSRRYRLVVAYSGESFDGWQSQPSGNAIQDHLLRALQDIQPGITTVQGSGRTDAGVHALAQIAHFDEAIATSMDGRAWREALNNRLPATLRVMEAEVASPDFHARFSAKGKVYRYEIFNGPVLPPWRARRAWHVRPRLQPDLLREAASCFVGYHDFTAFSANRGDPVLQPADPRRTILRAELTAHDEEFWLEFEGDGFLYKMVRMMTGAIVRAGKGALASEQIRSWLDHPEPGKKSPMTAPPDGLYLVRVRYD